MKVKCLRMLISVTIVHKKNGKMVQIFCVLLLGGIYTPRPHRYPFALSAYHNGSSHCLSHPYSHAMPHLPSLTSLRCSLIVHLFQLAVRPSLLRFVLPSSHLTCSTIAPRHACVRGWHMVMPVVVGFAVGAILTILVFYIPYL